MRFIGKRVLSAVMAVTVIAATCAGIGSGVARAATTLNGHTVVLDGSGKIVPWNTLNNTAYDQIVRNSWTYLLNAVPNDVNGVKSYYTNSYLNPDTQQTSGWPHNPAGLYAMFTESALEYYAYSGDQSVLTLAQNVLAYQLAHGMTQPTDNWASVPYASGDGNSLNYSGATYGNATGVGDGAGVIEPDKVGEEGYAFVRMYEQNGNTQFRDAAINAANALASHVRVGDASHSPWPFRVTAANNTTKQEYSAHVISSIELFDELIRLNVGNVSAYQSARATAWNWLMTYPMQNNIWDGYFEDVASSNDLSNRNQLNAMMVARYLLQHPETDANWEAHVRGIIGWVEQTFGQSDSGATIIQEQQAFMHAMGSHTARYASVNALLYQKTGDVVAKEKAYRSFNWATYMARSNGVNIDGPTVNNQWFTDGYGDYIRHFMVGMGAVPEWAPSGQSHLVDATGVVKSIAYTPNQIDYITYDPSSVDQFKLAFVPGSVSVNGTALQQSTVGDGWNYDTSQGVLTVRHSGGTNVSVISSGLVGNVAPVASLTAPVSGSNVEAGTTVSFNATASDSDGSVASVEFLVNGATVATDTAAPYSYDWANAQPGSYTVSARATDNSGAVAVSNGAALTVTVGALPSPWQAGDVGSVGVVGQSVYSTGLFTVKGSGVDIWDAADSFHYVYQQLNGDGQITARIASQQNTDPWALAGVMVRQNLTAGSTHAIAALAPGNGYSFTWRSATGGSSSYAAGGTGTAPTWVRLVRQGATLTAFKSTNGTTWTQYATTNITFSGAVYVGLAVTSHNNAVLATDTFTDVTVSQSADTVAPTISSVGVANVNQNGATVSWTTNEAADSQIEYGSTTGYGLSTALNTSLVTAHSQVVSGLDAGTTYHYRVKSRDAAGNLATSGDFTFATPAAPDTQAPTVPQSLVASVAGTTVNLNWTASADNVAVTGYQVFRNGVQIGTAAVLNYADTTGVNGTTYGYTVRAYDAAGNISADSAVVNATPFVDIAAPSTPSGLANSAVSATTIGVSWSASTDNVGVTGYRVYRNGVQVGTVTTLSYTDVGLQPQASYSYTVAAVDAAGNVSGQSAPLNVTTTADTVAPSVPTGLGTSSTPLSITVSWSASTDNVGVTGYRVYRNGVQVGTVSSGTSFTDLAVIAGTTYSYVVVAYDAAGNLSAQSTPVNSTFQVQITVDKLVFTHQATAAATISAPAVTTTQPNELILAFITSDGPNATQSFKSVNGGGLTWTLRQRANVQRGTAEIWQAVAASPVTNMVVTATRNTGSYQGAIVVAAFTGASTAVNGVTAATNAATGAPSVSLVTTGNNSWVWGVGNDWDRAVTRTVGTNQAKVDEYLYPMGDTGWVQRMNSTTVSAGSSVTLNDTAPTNDRWNFAAIEIRAQ